MKADSMKRLTKDEAKELRELEVTFERAGGRGVEMADRIDYLRAKRDGELCEVCGNSLVTWEHDTCDDGEN